MQVYNYKSSINLWAAENSSWDTFGLQAGHMLDSTCIDYHHIGITRSHPEMVSDMRRVTLNFDLSKIPFVHF